jgi:hypothetical protein
VVCTESFFVSIGNYENCFQFSAVIGIFIDSTKKFNHKYNNIHPRETVSLLLLYRSVFLMQNCSVGSGFMFDAYKTYDEGFILMGLMIAFSGFMLYPVPCLQRRLKVRGSKKTKHKNLIVEDSRRLGSNYWS